MQTVKRLVCRWLAEELNENNICYYAIVAGVVFGSLLVDTLKDLLMVILAGAFFNLSCYTFLTILGRNVCLPRLSYNTIWERLEVNETTAAVLIIGAVVTLAFILAR
jgi:hypothetical protein